MATLSVVYAIVIDHLYCSGVCGCMSLVCVGGGVCVRGDVCVCEGRCVCVRGVVCV